MGGVAVLISVLFLVSVGVISVMLYGIVKDMPDLSGYPKKGIMAACMILVGGFGIIPYTVAQLLVFLL